MHEHKRSINDLEISSKEKDNKAYVSRLLEIIQELDLQEGGHALTVFAQRTGKP